MKLNAIFAKKSVDWFSTNKQITPSLQKEIDNKENRIVSYTLNNRPLTLKFIKYWQAYRKFTAERLDSPYMEYNVNYYPMKSKETFYAAKQRMNETIERLNFFGISIDKTLCLNIESADNEIKKLNELHFVFEKEAILLKEINPDDYKNYHEVWNDLERINNLVHFLENFNDHNLKYGSNNFHISVRPGVHIAERGLQYYTLQDDDYKDFVKPSGGDVVCDFATVGKDLFYCSCTDDIELVKRNEVKQQSQLTDFIFLNFGGQEKEPYFRDHYRWCEANQVEKYLDYKSPKYSPGRHVFGRIDEPIYTGRDFYEKILSITPAFIGYYLSDDSGSPLVPEGM